MSSIINFLGSLRTGKGHLVSYGSYRMFKATVVNTLTLSRQIAESPSDQILLEQLSSTIQRTNPDGAKYAECFDLDDLINRRIELYDKQPYSAMSRDVSAHRALARQCAVINLKLYGLYRSDDCLQMQRGATFDEFQDPSLGSHWGPLSKSEDGEICPEWVHLRLTSTKTTGLLEVRIPFCPTEPALCPVLALYSYVKMHVGLPMAHHVGPTSPIWLITNSDMTSGKKCFRPLGTADPIAKDTKTAMTDAGISDAFGAHALRSASASAHLDKGASEVDLMAFARWSSTSVFRKFYARTKAKEFSVLDVIPSTEKRAVPSPPPPLPTQAPVAKTPLPPRFNHRKAGAPLQVPGSKWWKPPKGKWIVIHCTSCWDPDDHTMVWCRSCNRHFHAHHLLGSAEEVERNHIDGWYCDAPQCRAIQA